MTRYIIRPARGIVAHLYDVYDDTGRACGRIAHDSHTDTWRYAPKKSTPATSPLDAPTLAALRVRMRSVTL